MSLTYQTLHRSPQLQIQRIACRPETRACSAEEYAPANLVVFPLHGIFMKHHACGGEVLVASGSASMVDHAHAPEPATRDRRAAGRRREQVHTAALALAAAPERRWTLPQLARFVHSSQFHLARAFRQQMGESIHRYLLRARLASALQVVMDSDTPLTDIAAQLNFATPSHFAAAFRRAYGVTPSALRAAARGAGKLRTILTA